MDSKSAMETRKSFLGFRPILWLQVWPFPKRNGGLPVTLVLTQSLSIKGL